MVVQTAAGPRLAHRTCPLCEAICGLTLTVEGDRITKVRGDGDHVLSHGFICPKGVSFGELVHDPDRLRRPLVRDRATGRRREVSWDEAFGAVERGLRGVLEAHGPQAVGVYLGNPNVHTMGGSLFAGPLVRALGTRNLFTASTVDQMPKHVSCGYLFGDPLAIPVPDLDRTDFLVLIGANPADSNGSLCTAPGFLGRLRAIRARGGTVVVIDPRRTRTASVADEHLFVRPGTDALLLFALVHTLFDEGLVELGRLAGLVTGVEEVAKLAAGFPPELVAPVCGVEADGIRRLARRIAAARSAAVYGRIGTTTVAFGTLASWLIDVVNVLTGNLDRAGGAMFPRPAHAETGRQSRRPFQVGRWTSRVRGLPEVRGELPLATLADELETPGDGQVRALITVAGNPALSAPDSGRLDRALAGTDFMVSVDPYLNETTRHADVILPPTDPARVGHYDFAMLGLAVRNVVAYSPPVLPPDPGGLDDSAILSRLALIATGPAAGTDPDVVAELLVDRRLASATAPDSAGPLAGRDPADLKALVTGDRPAERVLDVMVRTGPYGDFFGAEPDGLTLERLKAQPHGIDLGPLVPRLPDALRTSSGQVELCPQPLVADVDRLREVLDEPVSDGLLLIGRRHLRSNNSWMHNVDNLSGGSNRFSLLIHPDDAKRLDLSDGGSATVTSSVGAITVPVEVTDTVMPGVVSLPHGWGHGQPDTRMAVAAARPGLSSNTLTDATALDHPSGNAVLSGIPVDVAPV